MTPPVDSPSVLTSPPSSGVRVLITNLHPVVSEEDVVELFSVAGRLRKARMMRQGTAEVVYSTRDEAVSAVRKYHNRELDGECPNVFVLGPNYFIFFLSILMV